MKKTLPSRILVLLLLTNLIGCSSDDDTVTYEDYSLAGKWHLVSYGGGFTGQFTNYNKEVITWKFDTIANQIHIKNKREYFGPNLGSYPYQIRQEEENQILYLNDSVQGILYINEKELRFNHVGLQATFKR